MLNRFKPIKLSSFDNFKIKDLMTLMEGLKQESLRRKAVAWKVFRQHYDDILAITKWIHINSLDVIKEFPCLENGGFHKNRHLLVKEYAKAKSPSGSNMFSHGFEGTNFRLVVASDSERKLHCMYREYLNLSGRILNFRKDFPEQASCELCSQGISKDSCAICGRSCCKGCSTYCPNCNKTICATCSANDGVLKYSAHDWYFHKTEE